MEQSPSWEGDQFSQPNKKFPAFCGTRRFFTVLTSARHLSLSWANTLISHTYINTYCCAYTCIHNVRYLYIIPYNKIVWWMHFCTFICVLFEMNFVTATTHRVMPRLLLDEGLKVHTCIFMSTLCIRLNVFSYYYVALPSPLRLVVALSLYSITNHFHI
jgi:hypothetical protein